MFAIIETGGKQYRVEQDDLLKVEKLDGEIGEQVTFDRVLLVNYDDTTLVGKPLIEDAMVQARILDHDKGRKVIIFQKRRRKKHRNKTGHRQWFTSVQIEEIKFPGYAPTSVEAEPPTTETTAPEDATLPETDSETSV